MSLDTLISRITSSNKYCRNYSSLLKRSVRSQIPNIQHAGIEAEESIEWGYLISCASIFAKSADGKALDSAYRICQASVCEPDLHKVYKNAAAMLFDILSNAAATSLSLRRGLIDNDYLSHLSWGIIFDVKQKQFANTIIDNNDLIILNEFQKEVYTACESSQVTALSAPTSAGKSFILQQVLLGFVRKNAIAKIVYLVPTRALIQQVEIDIRTRLKRASIDAETSSVPILPSNFNSVAYIFVFTQERLQWVLSEHQDIHFDLVIVDEAHKIGDGSRGVLLQEVLQQLSSSESTRFIFASPMSENPDELFRVLKGNVNTKQIISEIVTVNQNLLWVSKADSSTKNWTVDLMHQHSKMNLGNLVCERITKTSTRLPILAYRLAAGMKGNLLYVNGAADAEKVAQQLKSMIMHDHPDYSPTERTRELIKLIRKSIHPNYALTETLKGGVAFHYGNMPLAVRNEIEELFKLGDISFLVCTSTLIEGVNLPAKSIYVRGPEKGKHQPMNEMDFWNLAGRAGRLGMEFQGNIFCLDAGDNNVWKNGTPEIRTKYHIKSSVDRVLETKRNEFINYVKSKNAGIANPEMDYVYTYFLEAYFRYGKLEASFMPDLYGIDLCREIDSIFAEALSDIEIPAAIISKNQGVNPLSQQRLFEYFKSFDRDASELIPPYPEDDDAQIKYLHIIGRISTNLTGETHKLNAYRSVLITNWMRGYGLARIISDNISWHNKRKTGKNIATIIRDTMRDIEEYARFRFLKYTTCYIDILKLFFITKKDFASIEKIPQLNLWLEFGASKLTQITLMSMGFTRTAALELADLIVAEDYDKAMCLRWFAGNNIHSMDLPMSIVAEAEKILELQ